MPVPFRYMRTLSARRGDASTADTVRDMGAKCRNWSKWGPNDELGTLNYITPETIVKAAQTV